MTIIPIAFDKAYFRNKIKIFSRFDKVAIWDLDDIRPVGGFGFATISSWSLYLWFNFFVLNWLCRLEDSDDCCVGIPLTLIPTLLCSSTIALQYWNNCFFSSGKEPLRRFKYQPPSPFMMCWWPFSLFSVPKHFFCKRPIRPPWWATSKFSSCNQNKSKVAINYTTHDCGRT